MHKKTYGARFVFRCKGNDLECRGAMLTIGIGITEQLEQTKLNKIIDWQLACYGEEGVECK